MATINNFEDLEIWQNARELCKKINQYTLDGILIKTFNSIKEAEELLNKKNSSIRHCLSNKCKTAYGYIWKYKEVEDLQKTSN